MMIKSQPSILELTVISAQGIRRSPSSLFSAHLRPFVTVTPAAACPPPCASDGADSCHVYRTRVDDVGGVNPTWGDTFQIPVEPTGIGLYIQLFTKRAFLGRGPAQLGWCHIPSSDIFDGPGRIRNLSYRVRDKDGSRGEGVVNVSVRLPGSFPEPGRPEVRLNFGGERVGNSDICTVIGVPVGVFMFANAQNQM